MEPIRITAVSYYNTLPLIYGIQHSGLLNDFSLELAVPSACATKLSSGEADLSLVPVGALSDFPEFHIVGNHCIGANGDVKTVLLLTNSPIEQIHTIYLDTDSRTSVNLVKVLASKLWKIQVKWVSLNGKDLGTLSNGEGVVLIGDKTFKARQLFSYAFDLAGEWFRLTGLPFVFAAWIAVKELPAEFSKAFESALEWGVLHIESSVKLARNLMITEDELIHYLRHDISFHLNEAKRKGMALFLEYLKELSNQ